MSWAGPGRVATHPIKNRWAEPAYQLRPTTSPLLCALSFVCVASLVQARKQIHPRLRVTNSYGQVLRLLSTCSCSEKKKRDVRGMCRFFDVVSSFYFLCQVVRNESAPLWKRKTASTVRRPTPIKTCGTTFPARFTFHSSVSFFFQLHSWDTARPRSRA